MQVAEKLRTSYDEHLNRLSHSDLQKHVKDFLAQISANDHFVQHITGKFVSPNQMTPQVTDATIQKLAEFYRGKLLQDIQSTTAQGNKRFVNLIAGPAIEPFFRDRSTNLDAFILPLLEEQVNLVNLPRNASDQIREADPIRGPAIPDHLMGVMLSSLALKFCTRNMKLDDAIQSVLSEHNTSITEAMTAARQFTIDPDLEAAMQAAMQVPAIASQAWGVFRSQSDVHDKISAINQLIEAQKQAATKAAADEAVAKAATDEAAAKAAAAKAAAAKAATDEAAATTQAATALTAALAAGDMGTACTAFDDAITAVAAAAAIAAAAGDPAVTQAVVDAQHSLRTAFRTAPPAHLTQAHGTDVTGADQGDDHGADQGDDMGDDQGDVTGSTSPTLNAESDTTDHTTLLKLILSTTTRTEATMNKMDGTMNKMEGTMDKMTTLFQTLPAEIANALRQPPDGQSATAAPSPGAQVLAAPPTTAAATRATAGTARYKPPSRFDEPTNFDDIIQTHTDSVIAS